MAHLLTYELLTDSYPNVVDLATRFKSAGTIRDAIAPSAIGLPMANFTVFGASFALFREGWGTHVSFWESGTEGKKGWATRHPRLVFGKEGNPLEGGKGGPPA